MKKNNTILLVAKFNKFGGTKIGFENLINFYKSANYSIFLVYYKEDINEIAPLFFKKYNFPVRVINKNRLFLKLIPFLNILINLFLNYFKVRKIIVDYNPALMTISDWGVKDFLSLLILKIKTVNIVHSYPTKKIKFLNYFIRFNTRKNKIFLTVSNYSKEQIINYWLNKELKQNVEVVYNCVLKKTRKNDRVINQPFYVLTIGHVVWYKNPETWLKVAEKVIKMNKFKKIQFIWAGNGELLEEYRKIAKKIKLDGVKFISYQEKVDKLYMKAAVYFQPSKIESFGLSVADAFSWEIPCVVSNAGGLPELVINNKNGFVVGVDDVNEYEKKISLLLNNLELNKKMGSIGKIIYENKFTEKVYQEKMNNLYTKIFNQNE